jgi:hypothetical protein
VSSRWPGWRTLPGIEIAPLAEKAREQGEPYRLHSYVWASPDQRYVTSLSWQVDAGAAASIPWDANWVPVVSDGMVTGFRGVKGGTIEELVQITTVAVPEGEPPWSPALTVRLPAEQIGMTFRSDSAVDGIDIDGGEEPHASLSVGFAGDDGSVTSVMWAITGESAASVIALIRERHGEPAAEFTAADGTAFHDAAAGAITDHGIFTCAHDSEAAP